MIITKTESYSAMDRTGIHYEYKKSQYAFCERVIAIKWNDTNELQLRHCKGDGRLSNFVIFNETTIPNGTISDTEKFVNEVMNPAADSQ